MPEKIKKYLTQSVSYFKRIAAKIPAPSSQKITAFFSSWWHFIAIIFALIIFLYYPFGGLMVENIDKNTNIEINQTNPDQSATIEMMSFLINREINEKMWTPNLPFFFPSYFLDNMPSFQLGIISSVSQLSKAMAAKVERRIDDQKDMHLKEAAKLLQYPGNIWMFSPDNHLMPVPSSHSQYRKARKQLIKFNYNLNDGTEVFYKNPADLAFFLQRLSRSLNTSIGNLENQIREYSTSYIDNQADNIFYYTQGQIYGDYLLLKALAVDYKDIIIHSDIYLEWTQMLNALEQGTQISPLIVRNGEISSSIAPNHLNSLAFYTLKAQFLMNKIATSLRDKNLRKQ